MSPRAIVIAGLLAACQQETPVSSTTTEETATSPTDGTGGETSDDTAPTIPPVVVEGGVRVDPGDRTVLGAVDLVETADGTLWVSWVSEDADGWRQAFVARSADGGASFGAPIQVVSDGEPLSGWPRRPRLNARDDRVFVSMSVFESPWTFADLYISDSASQTATFTRAGRFNPEAPWEAFEYPMTALSPSGEPWAVWLATFDAKATIFYAHEGDGWKVHEATPDANVEPCECCPVDLVFGRDGTAVFAWRGDFVRDIWVASLDAVKDRVGPGIRATFLDWEEVVCPQDGPRLTPDIDGAGYVLAFSDSSQGAALVHTARGDAMGNWEPTRSVDPAGAPETRPVIQSTSDGQVWLAYETERGGPYRWSTSADAGATWSGFTPAGGPEGNLAQTALASGVAGTFAAGFAGGAVWVVRLDSAGEARK